MQSAANSSKTSQTLDTRQLVGRGLLALVALALVAILLAAILGTGQSAGTILSIFSTRFLGIFIEAAPSSCLELSSLA
ncbi:MAG: hypothetical protein R3E39_24760 [Anaerolineae bacterium]